MMHTEAENRTMKAALLAKTAISHGAWRNIDDLDNDLVRQMLLRLTPRPANPRHQAHWDLASDETWAQVKVIVAVFG